VLGLWHFAEADVSEGPLASIFMVEVNRINSSPFSHGSNMHKQDYRGIAVETSNCHLQLTFDMDSSQIHVSSTSNSQQIGDHVFVVVLLNVPRWKLYMPVDSIPKQQQFIQAGLVRHYKG
jgi:hypothetical protein